MCFTTTDVRAWRSFFFSCSRVWGLIRTVMKRWTRTPTCRSASVLATASGWATRCWWWRWFWSVSCSGTTWSRAQKPWWDSHQQHTPTRLSIINQLTRDISHVFPPVRFLWSLTGRLSRCDQSNSGLFPDGVSFLKKRRSTSCRTSHVYYILSFFLLNSLCNWNQQQSIFLKLNVVFYV